jgi:formin-binding protein 1
MMTATSTRRQSPSDTVTTRPSMIGDSRSTYAHVLYSYEASNDPHGPHDHQELSIRQGETVMILSQDDGSGWALAQSNLGVSGWIPANYVKLLPTQNTTDTTTSSGFIGKSTITATPIAATASPPSIAVSSSSSSSATSTPISRFKKVRALYDYEAQSHLELTIRKGDVIELVRTDIPDSEGWWEGKLGSRLGQFPANYVQPFHS